MLLLFSLRTKLACITENHVLLFAVKNQDDLNWQLRLVNAI